MGRANGKAHLLGGSGARTSPCVTVAGAEPSKSTPLAQSGAANVSGPPAHATNHPGCFPELSLASAPSHCSTERAPSSSSGVILFKVPSSSGPLTGPLHLRGGRGSPHAAQPASKHGLTPLPAAASRVRCKPLLAGTPPPAPVLRVVGALLCNVPPPAKAQPQQSKPSPHKTAGPKTPTWQFSDRYLAG
jgi:hypothetical protein